VPPALDRLGAFLIAFLVREEEKRTGHRKRTDPTFLPGSPLSLSSVAENFPQNFDQNFDVSFSSTSVV
jgi:hypothetical protein